MRWTEEQLAALQAGRRVLSPGPAKHRNEPTVVDGIRFASKKEADYYQQLLFMKAGNAIKGFTRQVSLPLRSSKRRMVIDFMVVELDGRVRWIDTKGYATTAWKIKKDELEHSLGIQIETV